METTEQKIRNIKQAFRLKMNGIASNSMRQKGVEYGINWGIPLGELKRMSEQMGKNSALGLALWKERVRECNILAVFVLPAEDLEDDIIEELFCQIKTQEMAEIAASGLFAKVRNAVPLALRHIARGGTLPAIAGYNIISRLVKDGKGETINERDLLEIVDQAVCSIQSGNVSLSHAAYTCLMNLSEMSHNHYKMIQRALKTLSIDF